MPANELIKDVNANLDQYPTIDKVHPTENHEFSIGDLHANALYIIYFMIRQNIMVLSQENYDNFRRIYDESAASGDISRENKGQFEKILAEATFNPVGNIRLMGDETADRGANDYFILKLIEKLDTNKVPYEIIDSNHSFGFKYYYENPESALPFIRNGFGPQFQSVLNLARLMDFDPQIKEEVETIIKKHYKPHLKLISYTLNQEKNTLNLHSHAPIDPSIVKLLAESFKVPYSGNSAIELAQSIELINQKYADHVLNNTTHTLCPEEEIENAGGGGVDQARMRRFPVVYATWNRNIADLNRPKQLPNGDLISYTHGHDYRAIANDYIFNLDSFFGKPGYNSISKEKLAELKNKFSYQLGNVYCILYSPLSPKLELVLNSQVATKEEESLIIPESSVIVIPEFKSEEVFEKKADLEASVILPSSNVASPVQPSTFQPLIDKIAVMKSYGESITAEDSQKGQAVIKLADELEGLAKGLMNCSPNDFKAQADYFYNRLHSQDALLATHRKAWKPIIANIAIALSGIGLIFLAVQLIHSKVSTGNASFFFSKTNSQMKAEDIEAIAKQVLSK